jgi:hypothetical protein
LENTHHPSQFDTNAEIISSGKKNPRSLADFNGENLAYTLLLHPRILFHGHLLELSIDKAPSKRSKSIPLAKFDVYERNNVHSREGEIKVVPAQIIKAPSVPLGELVHLVEC